MERTLGNYRNITGLEWTAAWQNIAEDGSKYKPDSLRVMHTSLDRHFRENGAPYSLLKDKTFVHGCQVLNGKAIELCKNGRAKWKNKADPVMAE